MDERMTVALCPECFDDDQTSHIRTVTQQPEETGEYAPVDPLRRDPAG